MVNCSICGKETENKTCCSTGCLSKHASKRKRPKRRQKRKSVACAHCGTTTTNAKFCSRHCAILVNNRLAPKRIKTRIEKPTITCRFCNAQYPKNGKRGNVCPQCISDRDVSNATIGSYRDKVRDSDVPTYWRCSEVRAHCRKVNAHRERRCQVCGYDKHVEFCHIRAQSDFPDDATLSEVNDPSNVAVLCRNHHWELDHGQLSLIT